MNSRRAGIRIGALIGPVILCGTPSQAQAPTNQTSTTPSGAVNAPAAIGGIEDRSYVASGLTAASKQVANLQSEIGAHLAALSAPHRSGYVTLPPDDILSVDFNFRAFRGHTGPLYAPSLTYSNSPHSLDLTAQYFAGSLTGFALGARFDVAGGRGTLVRSLARTRAIDEKLAADQDLPQAVRGEQLSKDKASFISALNTSITDFVDASRETRVAILLGNESFNGLGNLFNVGVSTSQLLRFGHRDGEAPGLTPLLSLDSVAYSPQGAQLLPIAPELQHSTSFIRPRLALTFQDRTLYYDSFQKRLNGIWKYRLGVEYDFRTVFDPADTVGLFFRWRANEHFQAGITSGFRSDHQDFVGLNLSFSLDTDKHSPGASMPTRRSFQAVD
jgi:hypothetical protein